MFGGLPFAAVAFEGEEVELVAICVLASGTYGVEVTLAGPHLGVRSWLGRA